MRGTWSEVSNREGGDVRPLGILAAAEKSEEPIEALYGKELRKVNHKYRTQARRMIGVLAECLRRQRGSQ